MRKEFKTTIIQNASFLPTEGGRVQSADLLEVLKHKGLDEVLGAVQEKICVVESGQSCVVQAGDWFYYKLRDRANDGPGWISDSLTDWHYGEMADRVSVPAVEESTYWLDPRGSIRFRYRESDQKFIINPFQALPSLTDEAEGFSKWNSQFERLLADPTVPLPGYFSDISIPGLRRHILDRSLVLLNKLGYAQLTAVPTWFHTALLYEHLGFCFTDQKDKESIEEIKYELLEKRKLDRVSASWQLMRQFWAEIVEQRGEEPEKMITSGFILRNTAGQLITYPLRPERNVWMYRWT